MFSALRRLGTPGRPLGGLLFYELVRQISRGLFTLVYRARIYGRDNVPVSGPLLIAANHQSFLDPPLVGGSIRRHCTFIARSGLFKFGPFGLFIKALNALPLKEGGGDAGAIKETLRRLERGEAVVIFPEGSRCEDGAQHEFKRGVALLMKRAKCPVVPAAVEGCFDAWPIQRTFPRLLRQRVIVSYGTPIAPDELMKDGADAALARIAAEVDRLRLDLRAKLRIQTHGRLPSPGPGDAPAPSPSV